MSAEPTFTFTFAEENGRQISFDVYPISVHSTPTEFADTFPDDDVLLTPELATGLVDQWCNALPTVRNWYSGDSDEDDIIIGWLTFHDEALGSHLRMDPWSYTSDSTDEISGGFLLGDFPAGKLTLVKVEVKP